MLGDQVGDVFGRADDRRVDDALADPPPVVVDEADDAIGEVVLRENLTGDRARGFAGADDEDAFLELASSRRDG